MNDCFPEFKNQHSFIKKKSSFLFSAAYFFIVMFLFSCAQKPEEQNKNASTSVKEKTVWTEKDETELKKLLKNFNRTKDISNNIIWYSHKNIPTDKTNLHAEVNGTDCYCYLISMYCGKSPLSNDSVQVIIGKKVLSTKKILPSDRRNRKSNFKNLLFETIHFTEGTDNNIPEFIALNDEKDINVKLIGQEKYYEYALSKKLIMSIKEAYELTEMLKRKNSAL